MGLFPSSGAAPRYGKKVVGDLVGFQWAPGADDVIGEESGESL